MPEVENRENGTTGETTADPTGNGGSSTISRGVKTALVATAVGTAVAAAARARSGSSSGAGGDSEDSGSDGGGSSTAGVRERFERASKRGEPFVAAVWDAARDSLEPLTKNGARQAGRFVAGQSPEFVRQTIIPPFVEG